MQNWRNGMAVREWISDFRKPIRFLPSMVSAGHDLVDRYGISVSQMTSDMFHLP